MRLYVDGKPSGARMHVSHGDRLGDSTATRFDVSQPFMVQVGSMNSGWDEARGVIDELRISRTARYTEPFVLSEVPSELDASTMALLHFDGTLEAEGLDGKGRRYAFYATAGAAAVPGP